MNLPKISFRTPASQECRSHRVGGSDAGKHPRRQTDKQCHDRLDRQFTLHGQDRTPRARRQTEPKYQNHWNEKSDSGPEEQPHTIHSTPGPRLRGLGGVYWIRFTHCIVLVRQPFDKLGTRYRARQRMPPSGRHEYQQWNQHSAEDYAGGSSPFSSWPPSRNKSIAPTYSSWIIT